MIQLNELSPYGYGMMLYSPDVLVDFLKAQKCRARKLCSYFDKNKSVFYKAIENGVALPIYPITIAKYAIFVSINEAETNAPEGWEQICKYDDFFIQVGNSNKLCWSSFDYFEHSKEPLDKRPSADCKIHQHGPEGVMLPVYYAVDVEIPQGNYRYDLVGYKRIEPLDESVQENYGKNYAYGFHFRSTDTMQNENLDKDNDKIEYDILHYSIRMERRKMCEVHFGEDDFLIDGFRLNSVHVINKPYEPEAEFDFYMDSGKDCYLLRLRNNSKNTITLCKHDTFNNNIICIVVEKQLRLNICEELGLIIRKLSDIEIPEYLYAEKIFNKMFD